MSSHSTPLGSVKPASSVRITENQREILLRLFAGYRENEIAADTDRRPSTISNTVRRVRAQLGARTEYDLLRECLRQQIVGLDQIVELAALRYAKQRPAGAMAIADDDREVLTSPRAIRVGTNVPP